jgi:TolB-like protein
MKAYLCILLALPASLFCAPPDPPANVRVAVFDFQTDGSVEKVYGVRNAGETVANLLTVDLSGLLPLAVVDRPAIRQRLGDQGLDPARPVAREEARQIGARLGAGTLVDGRIYSAGAQIIIAARVVSAETGETLGTMVKGDRLASFADLISQLGTQIGRIALVHQGLEPAQWSPASIIGSREKGANLSHDEVACVMDIDGGVIPDETEHWSQERPLLPGLHEIFVRYYDGTSIADHSFVLDAKPGASYEVSFYRQPDMNPRLWIQDRDTHRAATTMAEEKLGVVRNTVDTLRLPGAFGPFGYWSEQTGNPDFVRPSAAHPK